MPNDRLDAPSGILGAFSRLAKDTVIPFYDSMGGPNWGTTQQGPNGAYINYVGYVSRTHDNSLNDRNWVLDGWTPTGSDYVAPGPIGVAYVLLGTGPFWLHNDTTAKENARSSGGPGYP